MTPTSDDTSPRAAERLAWARTALADPALGLERASVDAGFRSYWRSVGNAPGAAVKSPAANSVIVMDSPPDKEDVRPWLRIRDLLEGGGVRVPHVLARDVERGFLLLEDLGTQTCLQVLTPDNADALFDAAIDQLLYLQKVAPPGDLPAYDEALLARELRLFDEWFLGRHLGVALECEALEMLDGTYRALIDAALAQPRVFVHRDFMPRNLMPVDGGVAVLDFQDAVRGPIAYDVLSLFKDAFASWPEARVADWIARYHARAMQTGLPVPELTRFRHDVDWIGVQRHLKVIGIFARLNHRDHKPKYLQDVPRFFAYLDAVLPRYREFDGLRALIDTRVRPAMAAQAATA